MIYFRNAWTLDFADSLMGEVLVIVNLLRDKYQFPTDPLLLINLAMFHSNHAYVTMA